MPHRLSTIHRFATRCLLASLSASCMLPGTSAWAQAVDAAQLRADALTDPVMAPVAAPTLSWQVTSNEQNQSQTAYRIIAASSLAKAEAGQGDLWDSGKVNSADSLHADYAGQSLQPSQRVFWRVKVWDAQGGEGAWSDVATFGAPLPSDAWTSDLWIGLDTLPAADQAAGQPKLGDAQWIGNTQDLQNAPQGPMTLGTRFALPRNAKITKAEIWLAADDRFELSVNGHAQTGGGNWKEATPVDVTQHLRGGNNVLRVKVTNDSQGPTGLCACLTVSLEGGRTITVPTNGDWTIGKTDDQTWQRPQANEKKALVLSEQNNSPIWRDQLTAPPHMTLEPVRYLRQTFDTSKPIQNATLYITSLGFSDAYINGELVTSRFISDFTHFEKRVYAYGFDVTKQIKQGDNAIGLTLADGWFSGYLAWVGRDVWGKDPRVAAQLVIEHTDGTQSIVKTGSDWQANTGPIRGSDMLMGETHDATITRTDGFATTGFDATGWLAVDTGSDEVKPLVEPMRGVPMDAFHEFEPQSVTEPKPGVFVFDMGRNFAGVARLKVHGKPGQQIQIRYAERLNPDGTIYTTNLRSARATDLYICRGEGEETWEPRYTFHGFQYVEVTGIDQATKDTVTGVAIGSLTPVVGSFDSSSDMLNQLASNIYWTQRSNFISIPTDCPQRNERMGWTGDAQVYIRTAGLWCDTQAFFDKWLVDLVDGTTQDGNAPKVAPRIPGEQDGGPAWADATTICPWAVYEMYEDVDALKRHYPAMKAYVDFNVRRMSPGHLPPQNYHAFGDWLDVQDPTPKDVIFMAYWAQSTRLVAQTAELLGNTQDAKQYNQLLQDIIAAFNDKYVDQDGRIQGDSQTGYVLALAYDLVTGERFEQAAKHLVRNIEERDWHLSTGFIGTKDLMLALAKIGRNDVAQKLMMNEDYPSWGFSIQQGATSIWERWDGWTPERGFQDPGMNSFAHYAFGAVYQWMVENIGGIQLIEPGYKHFRIAPVPQPVESVQAAGTPVALAPTNVPTLDHADLSVDTVRGTIRSQWAIKGQTLSMAFTIPANTTAEIVVPTANAQAIRLNGKQIADSDIPGLTVEGNVLHLGSGEYNITAPAR